MAGRPSRASTRATADCRLVVDIYLRDGAHLERVLHDGMPISFRRGRSRSISHRHAITFALDAARRTRVRAGTNARTIAFGRGADARCCRAVDNLIRRATALL